jgi:hypothetical protein
MPDRNGRAYALTALCPIRHGAQDGNSLAQITRARLHDLPLHAQSPFAAVPNTYFWRFYVLNDVLYQGSPARRDQLRSSYLVLSASLHGELEPYLSEMWRVAEPSVRHIWEFCVGFAAVGSAREFAAYIRRCQVRTTFFFVGSTDEPLGEQLKGLYLKQELARFAFENQGAEAAELQRRFEAFAARTQPGRPEPRWVAGSAEGAST